MENRFDHNEFEQFVKESADQYRMFPSEKVWKGIHKNLHTRPRWYGFGLGFLILTTSVVTWVMLNTSGKNNEVISSLPKITAPMATSEVKQPATIIIAPAKPASKLSFVTDNLQKDLFINEDYASPVAVVTSQEPVTSLNTATPAFTQFTGTVGVQVNAKPLFVPKQVVAPKPADPEFAVERIVEPPVVIPGVNTEKEIAAIREEISRNRGSDYPLTIESVINSYQHNRRKNKLSLTAFITPSISYRELKENKPFIAWTQTQAIGMPNAYYAADIDNVVNHKPDLGLQLGITAGLPISKKLRFVTGLQFNVSKYDIKAYTHPTEMTTISLSNYTGGRNTVSAPSDYRNTGGITKADWLRNLYFSASVPIGLDMKLIGNRRTYFGISGTMQPTYIIGNKSYLLSTDYKNYAEVPSLTRKWNLNAGMEMYAGVTTGKMKWRVGPQVRYQIMSSYQERYPIMEHLFDFGLKMGIMLNH